MKLYDFRCTSCGNTFEALVRTTDPAPHCSCGEVTAPLPCAPKIFSTIVPTTRTSKKYKAGYAHKYVNRPAEKVSVAVPRPILE